MKKILASIGIIAGLFSFSYAFAGTASGTYTVVAGDSLSSIANANGLTLGQLINLNPQLLHPGDVLNVGTIDTPTTTPANPMCTNFGHDIGTSGYDLSNGGRVDRQLAHIVASNIHCIRLAFLGLQGNTNDYLTGNQDNQKLALRIKQFASANNYPIYVIIGDDWGTLRTSNYTLYDANVIAEAKWAQANGIDQISLGNEQEYRLSGITKAQWAAHLNTLAGKVRAVAPNVKISYDTSGDFAPFWVTQTMNFDLLGLNLYCGFGCNSNYIKMVADKFGSSRVYVSETNCDVTGSNNCGSDAIQAAEVQSDLVRLMSTYPSIPMYFFAWASGADGTSPKWGLFGSDGVTLQLPLTAGVVGVK